MKRARKKFRQLAIDHPERVSLHPTKGYSPKRKWQWKWIDSLVAGNQKNR